MQLDHLWKFMQVDMEADRFEAEMRQAPNRQKLLKQRNFLVEQQNNMKRIEAEVASMSDRLEAVRDEAVRLEGLLSAQIAVFDDNPPASIEDAEKQAASVQKLLDALNRYEQELSKMHKDSDVRDRQQKEIRIRAARTKAEYDQLKLVYDAEFKTDSTKLAQLKAAVEKKGHEVDPQLLERYQKIKQHCTPPMALLSGDQCAGCFMSLPQLTLQHIKAGEESVVCDNCGRILYVQE